MGMMQAVRCKFGQHDGGPIRGKIEEARHRCEACGREKPVKAAAPRGYGGPHGNESDFHIGGGGGSN